MIPRILHHVWTGPPPLPTQFLVNMHSWREKHPDWEFHLWTTHRLPYLRNSHVYFQQLTSQEQHEMVRAELLVQFGGLVPDINCECFRPMDDVLCEQDAILIDGGNGKVVMGCAKSHPLGYEANRSILRFAAKKSGEPAEGWARFHLMEILGQPAFARFFRPDLNERIRWHSLHDPTVLGYEPESIVIVVKTVSRDPQYIHQTLASMFAADPWVRRSGEVLLLVGNDDWSYLQNYLHHENIRVMPMTSIEMARLNCLTIKKARAALNRYRSFQVPLHGKRGVVIVEDDVIFRDRFLQRLLATIREMEEDSGLKEYALTLFSHWDFEAIDGTNTARRFCEFSGGPFVCTQGMYYPAQVVPHLAIEVERQCIENYMKGGDVVVGECMKGKMFATPRFLVQHVGEVSTGLGGTTMDQSVFQRPYVCLDPANGAGSILPLYPSPYYMTLAPGRPQEIG